MAEKEQRSPYPMAPANGYTRSDMEVAAATRRGGSQPRRKYKRAKCLLYVLLFALVQTGIILLFALTVTKIRTPKFRLHSATFTNITATTQPANPSLAGKMTAELRVKNTNFGRFKFDSASVYFFYRGARVGEVFVPKGKANWRSTKKFTVVVDIRAAAAAGGISSDQLAADLRGGVVPISSEAKLKGNVRLAMLLKKNRSSYMNCTMEIVTATQQLQKVVCK